MDREDDFGMADYNLSSDDDNGFNEQEYNFIHDLDSNNRNTENIQKICILDNFQLFSFYFLGQF
jgi:hypothetical protein